MDKNFEVESKKEEIKRENVNQKAEQCIYGIIINSKNEKIKNNNNNVTNVFTKIDAKCFKLVNKNNINLINSKIVNINASLTVDDLKNFSTKILNNKHNFIVIEFPHKKDEVNINCYCTNSIDTSNIILITAQGEIHYQNRKYRMSSIAFINKIISFTVEFLEDKFIINTGTEEKQFFIFNNDAFNDNKDDKNNENNDNIIKIFPISCSLQDGYKFSFLCEAFNVK